MKPVANLIEDLIRAGRVPVFVRSCRKMSPDIRIITGRMRSDIRRSLMGEGFRDLGEQDHCGDSVEVWRSGDVIAFVGPGWWMRVHGYLNRRTMFHLNDLSHSKTWG